MIAVADFPNLVERINSMRFAGATVDEVTDNLRKYCSADSGDPEVRALLQQMSDRELAVAALINGSRELYWDGRPDGPHVREALLRAVGFKDGAKALHLPSDGPSRTRMRRSVTPCFVPFPVDVFPEPVRSFVVASAEAIGCDSGMVAMPVLGVLAAAIGSSRRIALKRSWWEPAILWLGIVAESGDLKSPALDAALAPLQGAEDAAAKKFAMELKEHRVRMKRASSPGESIGQSDRAGGAPKAPPEPTCRRYIVRDVTTEAIALVLSENPRGLLLARDELSGWIGSFDAYRGGRGGDAATWLELHRGRPSTIDRKGAVERVVHVPFASVGVVGTIQPGALAAALRREHFDNGLAARLLLAMPPRRKRVWTEADVPKELADSYAAVVSGLLASDLVEGAPVEVSLSPEGKAAWVEFFNRHGAKRDALSGDLAAAWSKLECYGARLALVLHETRLAAGDPSASGQVDERDVLAAVRLVEWFGREAERVYAVLGETQQQTSVRQLIELIERRGGSVTVNELVSSGPRSVRSDAAAAEAALQALVDDEVADWVDRPPGPRGGRPTHALVLRSVEVEPKPPAGDGSTSDVEVKPPATPGEGRGFSSTSSVGAAFAGGFPSGAAPGSGGEAESDAPFTFDVGEGAST